MNVRRIALGVDVALLVAAVAADAWEPRAGGAGFWYLILVGGPLSLVWVWVGSLLVSREPRNAIGWIEGGFGLAFPVVGFSSVLGAALLYRDIHSLPGVWLGWFGGLVVGLPMFLPFLFLLFPTGHLLSRRWRIPAWIAGAVGLTGILVTALTPDPSLNNVYDVGLVVPNPAGVPFLRSVGEPISFFSILTVVAMSVVAAVSLVLRFRRSTGDQRQQIRWLAFVAGAAGSLLTVMALLSVFSLVLPLERTPAVGGIFVVSFFLFITLLAAGIPLATGVAILKYHLYDLDVVIKKTVQYAVLVGVLVVVVGLLALAIPVLLVGSATDQAIPIIVIGVVLAAILAWIPRPARRLADRLVYGKRATPYEVLSEFSERVGETYSADDVLPRMAAVLGEGTGAAKATVWLNVGGVLRPEAVWPPGTTPPAETPPDLVNVSDRGERFGGLSVEMPPDDPMNSTKEQLVRDLAAQAGLVLRNVRLIEELRDSRRRLVAAQDEERRRLERDIHDGAQQQLVALAVKARLARQLTSRDPAKAAEMLEQIEAETQSALEDLRDLAHGIYPPLLADRGLVSALEAQARKAPIPVTMRQDGVGRYPPDAEAAVYFCVLEALQNVGKYANASRVEVRLYQSDSTLRFAVEDDGAGFDVDSRGSGRGLTNMRDRLDALGGALVIDSAPGRGATVSGTVPVPAP
ncbi:MAG TPA: sensor histidine kinase [Actinomycetota bacterium]